VSVANRPRRAWPAHRVREILEQTQWLRLEAAPPELGPGEQRAIGHLLRAGRIAGELFEAQRHHQALAARRRLLARHEALGRPERTRDLLRLYRLFDGPIATTLDNELVPFLAVDPWLPGGAMYPAGVDGDGLRAFVDAQPERRREFLAECSVVRATTPVNLRRDLRTLRRLPVLAGTHPGLVDHLTRLADGATRAARSEPFYAVGYAVAWPDQVVALADQLRQASLAVADEDADLSASLRLRSIGVLADDVEVGDAAWIRGQFRNLDVVFGPWETYDDHVLGVKASYGLALLSRHEASTEEIRSWASYLPEIDAALPYAGPRRRDADVPMASYDVLAVFGSARNVLAETLPNDADVSRRYGRRILMRRNFGLDARTFANSRARYDAVMAPEAHGDLTVESSFTQTVGHELAHYAGPDVGLDGGRLVDRLGEHEDVVEELKAEVMSFTIARFLEGAGAITAEHRRGVLASLIIGGMRNNPPLPSQTYPVVRTMYLNRFLADGVVVRRGDRYALDHDRAIEAIPPYLAEIVTLQERAPRREVRAYIDRWVAWTEDNRHISGLLRSAPVRRYSFESGPLEPVPTGLEGDADLGRLDGV